MRRGLLCTLLWISTAQVAVAQAAMGAGNAPILPDENPTIERAGTPPTTPPSELDLRIDPRQLPSLQDLSDGALAIDGDWMDGATGQHPDGMPGIEGDRADGAAGQNAADRGLSFGLEVKPRTRMGALARQHEEQDPGLGGQLERLLERPAFGLRGRYRF
jgi:hypothetical protein